MARRRRRSKKWISWLIILILLVAAGIVGYMVWKEYFKPKEEIPVEINNTTQTEIKEDKSETSVEGVEEKPETIQYDGDSPNTAAALTGAITYASASETDLLIRVNIDQYLFSGQCELNLISDGNTVYSDKASIVSSATTATCEGFNVPLSQISNGSYKIVINLTSGDKIGKIEGEVDI